MKAPGGECVGAHRALAVEKVPRRGQASLAVLDALAEVYCVGRHNSTHRLDLSGAQTLQEGVRRRVGP
jgi:hypothetical protein